MHGIFSIPVQESIVAVTGATATGELTMASNATLYVGALAWLSKNDGSAQARIRLVKRVGSTKFMARRLPDDSEYKPNEGTGYSDFSAFAAGSSICMEFQLVPIVPMYTDRDGL